MKKGGVKQGGLNSNIIQAIVVSLLISVLILLIGWIKSDIGKLSDKVDQLTQSYVVVVGELHKKVDE